MTTRKKKPGVDRKQPGLEQALEELEALVGKMEDGELTLEESLASFQRGIELTRICRKSLKDAEQKVQILQEKAGVEALADFEHGD